MPTPASLAIASSVTSGPAVGERAHGGLEQPVAVALRVGAQRPAASVVRHGEPLGRLLLSGGASA